MRLFHRRNNEKCTACCQNVVRAYQWATSAIALSNIKERFVLRSPSIGSVPIFKMSSELSSILIYWGMVSVSPPIKTSDPMMPQPQHASYCYWLVRQKQVCTVNISDLDHIHRWFAHWVQCIATEPLAHCIWLYTSLLKKLWITLLLYYHYKFDVRRAIGNLFQFILVVHFVEYFSRLVLNCWC